MKSTVLLDVTIYLDEYDQLKNLRLQHAVDFGDVVLDRQKESHELVVDFKATHQPDLKAVAQVTTSVDGQIAFAHVILFSGARPLGSMASWVPLKHTSSFAVECLDTKQTIDCSVTLKQR